MSPLSLMSEFVMQIILSAEEVKTIYEALITELDDLKKQLMLERRKGRGELEKEYIGDVKALIGRFSPYLERT